MSSLLLLSKIQYISRDIFFLLQMPSIEINVTADALIAISYCLISIILIYLVREVENIPFKNTFLLFSAFLLSCGTTHVVEIWTLWHPNYWILGTTKAITASISLSTALSLITIIPKVFNLFSSLEPSNLSQQLNEQKTINETAEQKMFHLNQELQQSTKIKERLTDLTPNLLYIYDLVQQRNIYCNPFITELLGYTPPELQKFTNGLINELVHPEDLEQVAQHHSQCLLLKEDNYLEIEYRIRDTHNKWHWLQDRNTIFRRNSQGKPEQILGIAIDITKTKKIQANTKELNQKLEEKIAILETRDRSRIHLSQVNEFIQACLSLEEAQEVIADLLQPLFPNTVGIVYLMSNSKNTLNAVASWRISDYQDHFESNKCWAIRRGNPHQVNVHAPKLYCSHIDRHSELLPSLCLPMIAKGEAIGMLHLSFDSGETISQSIRDLAETVAQNLALSFANLKLRQELRYQSLRDPLTGLYNRRFLQESLKKELDRAHRNQNFVSVMMLDIDHFKNFNDAYGHSAGDLVLSKVGAYLLSAIREYDIACRYGGEELIVVMPDASIENLILRAEKIRLGIKNLELQHEGKKLQSISVSIGVSCFPDDSVDVKGLIATADKALYQAKADGRDCVKRF